MKSPQVKNCFDDVLRMLRQHEEEEAAKKEIGDRTAAGLRFWKQRAEALEDQLRLLGEEGTPKAEVIVERDKLRVKLDALQRDKLRAKLDALQRDYTALVEALALLRGVK